MALTPEWRGRIEAWKKGANRMFYRPIGLVNLQSYITKEQLTAGEVVKREFRPMPVHTRWGMKWEYGWVRTTVVVPEDAAGRRLVVSLRPMGDRGEAVVYVNGQAASGRSWTRDVTLCREASPGTTFDVLAEFYAGHGARVCSFGPMPRSEASVPEVVEPQAVVEESTYGIWNEDIYQLWMDVDSLCQMRDAMDPDSLRVSEIDEALRQFTCTFDPELPEDEAIVSARQARGLLRPLLARPNGASAPTMYAFGHAHLDVAWLWPLAETERKAVRTLLNQLSLMEEYPEYRFLHSQAHLFWMVKNKYPEVYERVRELTRAGRIIAEGGMWVEADTNISGGEALIRQFMHGKRYFEGEFGAKSELLWLPDVFGYSAAMPQILQGCGIKYFATAKIFWNYNGGEPFPHNTFTWEGVDGSKVLVHLCNDYNSHTGPQQVIQRWKERRQKDGITSRLLPFGHGDGGGGPTRDHLEYVRRQSDVEGVPRVKIASPVDYFKDLEQAGVPDLNYVGELYFQAHRGTYTSQAKTKKGNRKSELALREAELWGAAAQAAGGYQYPESRLNDAWRDVLLCQFHDILPGSSIARVYQEAEAMHAAVIECAGAVAAEARKSLTKSSGAHLTVFNSLNWDRTALVELPDGWTGAVAGEQALESQAVGGRAVVTVSVPSCGWTTISKGSGRPDAGTVGKARTLENEHLRVSLGDKGEITSIYDKDADSELSVGPCNDIRMYKDVPGKWDAWDLDSMYVRTPVELAEEAEYLGSYSGPVVSGIRYRRTINGSSIEQEISLRRGSRRIDFKTTVDWRETHKLLKVNFPVDIHDNEATHEIQFGHVKRPNHRSRVYDADRFEVCNHKWTALMEPNRGCAVLNDCKYGVNVDGRSINLTLLKSAVAPDMNADKGTQEFTYSFYAWNGTFAECDLVREGYELNCPVTTSAGDAGSRSLLEIDAPNVIVETVKPAEDGSGDIVVRMYESKRMRTRCRLRTSLPVKTVRETGLLEQNPSAAVSLANGEVQLAFRPFEIKTVRLQR